MAEEKGLLDKLSDFFAEYPVDNFLSALVQSEALDHVTEQTRSLLAELIGNDDCIIIGRCGNYIFKDRKDCISIFLKGNKDARIALMAKKNNLSTQEATDLVNNTDDGRRAYHNYYTGQTWGDAQNYHLCIDSNRIGFSATAQLIEDYISATFNISEK